MRSTFFHVHLWIIAFVLISVYNLLFKVTTLNHKYFRTHLEDSLSLGRSLVIEDIGEELDPVLDNILEKNFIKSGTSFKVSNWIKEAEWVSSVMNYMLSVYCRSLLNQVNFVFRRVMLKNQTKLIK